MFGINMGSSTPEEVATAAAIAASTAAIVAAIDFGFYVGIFTMAVFLITALLSLLLRDNPRACWLHFVPVTVLPNWTMDASRSDLGENLRLMSTFWLLASGIAAAFLVFSIWKNGIQTLTPSKPRLSIQWILVAFFFASVARPPISEEISLRVTLPGLGFLATMSIAFCVRSGVKKSMSLVVPSPKV